MTGAPTLMRGDSGGRFTGGLSLRAAIDFLCTGIGGAFLTGFNSGKKSKYLFTNDYVVINVKMLC